MQGVPVAAHLWIRALVSPHHDQRAKVHHLACSWAARVACAYDSDMADFGATTRYTTSDQEKAGGALACPHEQVERAQPRKRGGPWHAGPGPGGPPPTQTTAERGLGVNTSWTRCY